MRDLGNWRHICVDVQRMFLEQTPWHVTWMDRILPQIEEISGRFASHTVFTRFIPPRNPDDAHGMWKEYYRKWQAMTGEEMSPELLDLPASLRVYVPPARVFDKAIYSPWMTGELFSIFTAEKVRSVVISGGETDVCVLATVLGAIDLGFQVILLSDAICSGADETHDKIIDVLADRFSVQLELLSTEAFLATAT